MSAHPSRYTGSDLPGHIRGVIEAAIPGARAEVNGAGGHYTITVVAAAFAGRSLIEQQRLVYTAITELMRGDDAPVHAVDKLTTRTS